MENEGCRPLLLTRKENGFLHEKDKAFTKKPNIIFVYTADSFNVLPIFYSFSSDGDEKQLYRLVWDESGLQLYRHRKLHRDFRG